ncbi:hypothetical protein K474DRAFT_1568223, partial [Panus rudis PR-1116 ss-1]
VENYLYRLHRGVLSTHSQVFADMFRLPQSPTAPVQLEGRDNDHPIRLDGVVSSAFDNLLRFLYPANSLPYRVWTPPPYSTELLVDVLSQSALWGMAAPRQFALHFLEGASCPPVLRIHLAVRYGVPAWISPAFRALIYGPVDPLKSRDLDMMTTTVSVLYFKVR